MKRDINKGAILECLYDACKLWGVPGLAYITKVYFTHHLGPGPSDSKNDFVIGKAYPRQMVIKLNRKYWRAAPFLDSDVPDRENLSPRQRAILLHEMAHLVEAVKYARSGHGRGFQRLCKSVGLTERGKAKHAT